MRLPNQRRRVRAYDLIRAPFPPSSQDGWSPLHIAATDGHMEMAGLLMERGAEVDAKGHKEQTPLHWASRNGHLKVQTVLLSHGADPALRDRDGRSAVDFAKDEAVKAVLSKAVLEGSAREKAAASKEREASERAAREKAAHEAEQKDKERAAAAAADAERVRKEADERKALEEAEAAAASLEALKLAEEKRVEELAVVDELKRAEQEQEELRRAQEAEEEEGRALMAAMEAAEKAANTILDEEPEEDEDAFEGTLAERVAHEEEVKRARADRAEKLKQLKVDAALLAKEEAMRWVAERDAKKQKAEEAILANKEKIMRLTREESNMKKQREEALKQRKEEEERARAQAVAQIVSAAKEPELDGPEATKGQYTYQQLVAYAEPAQMRKKGIRCAHVAESGERRGCKQAPPRRSACLREPTSAPNRFSSAC